MKRYDGRTKPIPKPRPAPAKGKKAKSVGRGRVSGNTNRPMDRKTDKMKKIKATFNKFESTIVTATNREYR